MNSRAWHKSAFFDLLRPQTPILVCVAHPDDETVSASLLCQNLPRLTVVQVSDGSPRDLMDAKKNGFASREAYARMRRQETKRALSIARKPGIETVRLGFVD